LALYSWTGYTDKGKDTKGMIDASSPREAKIKLKGQGIFVSNISEEIPVGAPKDGGINLKDLFGKVKLEEITVMTRQLSTLIGASIPLVESLSALYEQTEAPLLKKTVAQVRDSVNEGLSFADALDQHKKTFPELYINMVRSGEASGALDVVLLRLAEYMEGQHRIRSKVRAAMTYPIFLFFIASAVLFYMLTSVVPKVVNMFESMNQVLPLPTRMLIAVSDFLGATWWILVIVFVGSIFLILRWKKTEQGSLRFDRIRMDLPLYGPIYRKISVANFARTLGTLLASGVPIIEALKIVKTVVQNRIMESTIDESIAEVMDGSSLALTLKKSGVFPPILIHMIGVGEKSGSIEEMLMKAAEAYEDDVETTVSGLTAVLEPLMIIFMGASVGFIIIAILMPMLQMSQIIR